MNFKGTIYYKGDAGYEEARVGRVFNHLRPNRYPVAVFFPEDADDVVEAVKLANEKSYKIATRSGGHSWAVWSVRDEGILLDLKHLNSISLNKATGIVSAGPATKGGHELAPFLKENDLFFAGGHCPTVGIGGFLLQGGQGWNARGWGWAAEQIESIDVVTANGELLKADVNQNSDLFWAARGAGPGFFGVVTCFHLKTRPLPKAITASTYVYPADVCEGVLYWLQTMHTTVANTVEIVAVGQTFEFGTGMVVHAMAFEDTPEAAQKALAPFEECPFITKAIVRKTAQPTTLAAEYEVQVKNNPEGHRWAVSNAWLKGNPDEVAPLIKDSFIKLPNEKTFTLWFSMAPLRALPDMAFSLQTDIYLAIYTLWETEEEDKKCKTWLSEQINRIEKVTEGQYLGDSDFTKHQRKFISDANFTKLQAIRAERDPKGLFHSYLAKSDVVVNKNEFE
ncbi:FAD-binding oxidoreductase [Flavobacterium sp. ZT3R17]|uniref:FAD-binding oxidoreductase n=1 Tax=Flavobacterium cryoconiti TaxID=3398736 RepID=UPI003A841AAA